MYFYRHFIANILLVLFSVTLIGTLAFRVFYTLRQNPHEAANFRSSASFQALPEINFSKNRRVVLIGLDPKCSFSNGFMPFVNELIHRARQNAGARVIALFDGERDEIDAFLREQKLEVEFIPKAGLVAARFEMTPTVVIADADRTILASYEGIPEEKRKQELWDVLEPKTSAK